MNDTKRRLPKLVRVTAEETFLAGVAVGVVASSGWGWVVGTSVWPCCVPVVVCRVVCDVVIFGNVAGIVVVWSVTGYINFCLMQSSRRSRGPKHSRTAEWNRRALKWSASSASYNFRTSWRCISPILPAVAWPMSKRLNCNGRALVLPPKVSHARVGTIDGLQMTMMFPHTFTNACCRRTLSTHWAIFHKEIFRFGDLFIARSF